MSTKEDITMTKLNDQELTNIAGGFGETNRALPTYGMNITCPQCKSSDAASFTKKVLVDPSMGSVEYQCKCGCSFVCYNGYVISKAAWITKCNEKNYAYPFA